MMRDCAPSRAASAGPLRRWRARGRGLAEPYRGRLNRSGRPPIGLRPLAKKLKAAFCILASRGDAPGLG